MAEPPTTVDATENPENHPGDATQPSDEILSALQTVNTETHGLQSNSNPLRLRRMSCRRLNMNSRVNVGPAARGVIQKSYEFALAHIGHDKDSGSIWSDYIEFLKAGETSSTWEEQQKMDALRKVYHRAVQIPLDNVERLWQDLEAFEVSLNRITAKKFMADLSPSHMQARTVLRQLQKHLGPLFPPLAPSSRHRALVGAWKAYLKWEESNPLEIEEKDKASLITRIQSVYRKAVIRMRYYSKYGSWHIVGPHRSVKTMRLSRYSKPASKPIHPGKSFSNACRYRVIPIMFSPLLNFAYAEVLEAKGDVKAVHEVYGQLLTLLQKALESLEAANKVRTRRLLPPATRQTHPRLGTVYLDYQTPD
ncbi:mRNA 3'-end-processing protein [Salix suchowensis]|nr:mRNA 3'-end-processing protein [Salix suchowensis]